MSVLLDADHHQNDFANIATKQGYTQTIARGDDQSLVVSTVNPDLPTTTDDARYNFTQHTKGPWGTGEEAVSPTMLEFYYKKTPGYQKLALMRFQTGNTVSGDYAIPTWWWTDSMYLSKDGKTSFFDAEVKPLWDRMHSQP
jgi:hypothetical protein